MPDDHEHAHGAWHIPDELWERIVPFLPPRKPHPVGGHRPRVDDRHAMDAMFFVLRTGCQWGALDATGLCSHSAAHRRFQKWTEADVFVALWERRCFRAVDFPSECYPKFVAIDEEAQEDVSELLICYPVWVSE